MRTIPGLDAFGTKLQRGDGLVPENFADIANITNITGPAMERASLDVSAHNSPDGYREFKGGIVNAGELEVEINYDPAEHDVILGDIDDEEPRNYKIIWPDTSDWAIRAVLTGIEPEAPFEEKLVATLTFQVTGKPVLTTAS